MTSTTQGLVTPGRAAALDSAHVGDIRGALGTISLDDVGARTSASARLKTLLAIVGPGLIVMVGDNDAGAFSTYGQAGQTYGTRLLWTFLLLVPVLYVNQEMVLRLGAVTGVGHARLILERFGRFWGAFSVIDLFILNALTIVTEFIGIALAASYLGVPRIVAVVLASLVIVFAASTGSFRRFERIAMIFCAGSLLLVPVYVLAHPPAGQMARGFTIPSIPGGSGQLATVMLLVIGIVGTTVAPWQLFFQQSYIIDKRITPRFMRYEKADLWLGIVIVVIGGGALMGATAAAFAGARHVPFTDASGLAAGLSAYAGHAAGALFAVALLDASMIGAFAVSLSTAYAVGDMLGLKHSLHRGVKQAKGFYAMYAALIAIAATIVLIPGSPLGLLTEGVQVLAGVLLPSATVFLLLLCNDKEVLGPWVNGRATNVLASIVVGILVMLSAILMVSVVFGTISSGQVIAIMGGCVAAATLTGAFLLLRRWRAARGAAALALAKGHAAGPTPAGPTPVRRMAVRGMAIAGRRRRELTSAARLDTAVRLDTAARLDT
ncbi:MAG TPA: Nramp family divalent metal transporter, partial [Streptosporangiaceae bacterium]|nr:Nramp family divalent metal transporter [Streptosporangiaceae bacterium]